MDAIGFGVSELILLMFILVFIIGLPVITLVDLAKKNLTGTVQAIWVLVICIVPLIGSLAYWIVKPTAES